MRRRIACGSELERLRRHIDDLFSLLGRAAEGTPEGWVPAVDLLEQGDRYLVRLDLPDVSAAHLVVTIVNRELHVAGHKGGGRAGAGRHYHCIERGVGRFEVEILLPSPVDPAGASARLRAGVLEVELPMLYGRRDAVHAVPVREEER